LLHPREKEEKVKDEGKNGKGRRRSSDGDFLLKEVMGKIKSACGGTITRPSSPPAGRSPGWL